MNDSNNSPTSFFTSPIGICSIGLFLVPYLGLFLNNTWIDEVFTYQITTASFTEHINLIYHQYDHPPLFFHLGWLWCRLSDSLLWGRLLVSIFSSLSILLIPLSLSKHTSPLVIAFTLIGIFCNGFFFFHFHNYRHYTLYLLFGLLYLLYLKRALLTSERNSYILSAVMGGLGLLSHHFMLFYLIFEVFLLPGLFSKENRKKALIHFVLLSLFTLLWLPIAIYQFSTSVGETIANILGSGKFQNILSEFSPLYGITIRPELPQWAAYLGISLVTLYFITHLLYGMKKREAVEIRYLIMATYLPVFIIALASIFRPVFAARFFIISGVTLWILHGLMVAKLQGLIRYLYAAPLLITLAIGGYFYLAHDRFPPYGEYMPKILDTIHQDEALVFVPEHQSTVLSFYAKQQGKPLPHLIHIPPYQFKKYDQSLEVMKMEVRNYHKVWVLYEFPNLWDPDKNVQSHFEQNWEVGPYQPLWDNRWVITYYENPNPGKK